jgi:hypothetical protein
MPAFRLLHIYLDSVGGICFTVPTVHMVVYAALQQNPYTDKKENKVFLKYIRNPEGSGCKVTYE